MRVTNYIVFIDFDTYFYVMRLTYRTINKAEGWNIWEIYYRQLMRLLMKERSD